MSQKSAQVDQLLVDWNTSNTPGASIAIVQHGDILYQQAYGMASLELNVPITLETVFPVASVAKQFTATAIAILMLNNQLHADDDMREYLPEFPDYGHKITLSDLIHHTSGIRDWGRLAWLAGESADLWTNDRVMELMQRQQGLNFNPRTQFAYCNTGYVLLTIIVERITGSSFREFCDQHIFKPLDMTNTIFRDDHHMIIKGKAASYRKDAEGELQFIPVHADVVGDFNLYTTVGDLIRWDQNFYDNKLAEGNPRLLDILHTTNPLEDSTPQSYAYGLFLDEYRGLPSVHHAGANSSCRSQIWRFTEQQLTIICLSNSGDFNLNEIVYGIADIYLANDFTEKRSVQTTISKSVDDFPPIAIEDLVEYSGIYHSNELNIDYHLAVVEDNLIVSHSRLPDMTLIPSAEDTFIANDMEWVFKRHEGNIIGFELLDRRASHVIFTLTS
jgi:CubicO group peptidase (beta-lactamase class C family)